MIKKQYYTHMRRILQTWLYIYIHDNQRSILIVHFERVIEHISPRLPYCSSPWWTETCLLPPKIATLKDPVCTVHRIMQSGQPILCHQCMQHICNKCTVKPKVYWLLVSSDVTTIWKGKQTMASSKREREKEMERAVLSGASGSSIESVWFCSHRRN